jgi:hypothetical protein
VSLASQDDATALQQGLVRVIARLVQPRKPGFCVTARRGTVQRLIAVDADWKRTSRNSHLGMRNAQFGREPEGRQRPQGDLSLARTRGHKVLYRVLPDALEQLMWIPGATRLHKENRAQRGAEWIGDLVLPEHTTVRSAVASGLDCTQDVTYPTRQTSIHPDPRNHSPIPPPGPV